MKHGLQPSQLVAKTKICLNCKKELPLEWFGLKNKKSDKRISKCRPCAAEYQTEWARSHYPDRKDKITSNKIAYKKKARDYVDSYKENLGCIDCRKKWPSYVLDFDHVRGIKRMIVSAMVADFLWKTLSKK